MTLLALLLAGCAPGTARLEADVEGIHVEASGPVRRVEVLQDGVPVVTQLVPRPIDELLVPVDWTELGPSRVEVRLSLGREVVDGWLDVPALPPLDVTVEAPLGAPPVRVTPGQPLSFAASAGSAPKARIQLRTRRAGVLFDGVSAGGVRKGERRSLEIDASIAVERRFSLDGEEQIVAIAPRYLGASELGAGVRVAQALLPAKPDGTADPLRNAFELTLPDLRLDGLLRDLALGVSRTDPEAPLSHLGVELWNDLEVPVDLAVRARFLGADRLPDPAFRPRIRTADDGTGQVSVLVRVPPRGTATAALPVFVAPRAPPGPRTLEVTVSALGDPGTLALVERTVLLRQGDARAGSVALLGALVGALALVAGAALAPGWLRRSPTADLTWAAAFSAIGFGLGLLAQLVGIALAAGLGPFAILVSALLDDTLRVALLATLVTLRPRPGLVAATHVLGTLLRLLVLGSFGPVDALQLGLTALTLETALWVLGPTRSPSWAGWSRVARTLSLSLALVVTSWVTTTTGLALSAVLFRLYWSDAYVWMVLVVPGTLYPALASVLAVPFADSLRRLGD